MTTTSPTSRPGATLVELLVTLAILGVATSVVTLAIRRIERPSPSDPRVLLADSLAAAIASSREITVAATIAGRRAVATARPDGSVIADTAFHFEPLTGRPAGAR